MVAVLWGGESGSCGEYGGRRVPKKKGCKLFSRGGLKPEWNIESFAVRLDAGKAEFLGAISQLDSL
jgi:hypothetical protein